MKFYHALSYNARNTLRWLRIIIGLHGKVRPWMLWRALQCARRDWAALADDCWDGDLPF